MKTLVLSLACASAWGPLAAQVAYDVNTGFPWTETTDVGPDAVVPGWFYNLGITGLRVQLDPAAPRTLVVKHVFPGTPAAGLVQVDDVLTGVEGQSFTEDHQNGYGPEVFGAQGPIGEFGVALDAVQGVDGLLDLTLTRGGSPQSVTLNVGTAYGSFSPTFPYNCPKSDLILAELLEYLRDTQRGNGSWRGAGGHENHIFAGLALLADGSPASMTAADNLATYYKNETNAAIPASGLNNWKYLAAAIYLSEYYQKTNAAWVPAKLDTLYGYLLDSQYTDVSQIVPGYHGDDPITYGFGGWGHNPGYEGYGPIAMTTGQGALALALMDRVGVTVDRARLDAAYGFLVRGTGANHYVWYADQDGSGGNPDAWADPGRTGAAAIANWMSPYNDPAYETRALDHATFMGNHPESFPDTHGSPTIGLAYAALGTHIKEVSFRQLMEANRWWFTLAHTPEETFYYQPNRDNAIYDAEPRFVASSVVALILSMPEQNLLMTERVAVDETPPSPDPMTFAAPPAPAPDDGDPLGVLAAATLAGSNPATGAPWQPGDAYRLAFVTSATTPATSTDIATYNAFVQGVADAAGLGGATWRAIGSTSAVSARGNTRSSPATDGTGMAVYLMDGSTVFATGHADLWDGANVALNRDESGAVLNDDRVFTGSAANGTQAANADQVLGGASGNVQTGRSDSSGGGWMVDFNMPAGGPQQMFALSDPVTILATGDPETEITMIASAATDESGVEYYFTETSGNPGGSDSGWQDSPVYTDSGLQPGTQYTYTVSARDKSPAQNVTAASAPMSATTAGMAPDIDPPLPNPASFAIPPNADSDSAISMTATIGTDASGPVEYLFTETSGNPGGTSSVWQTSPSYTDGGLDPSTLYTYTVTLRDALGNTGIASSAASATTDPPPAVPPP